jgi:heat shock protein HtpX
MTGINRFKTWILIATLGGLFVAIGALLGGVRGASIMLVVALVFNFAMYWFSDRIAIAASRSKPVTEREMPELYSIVRELIQARNMPMPAIYVSEMPQPNAFATGRNPSHAAVSVTRGLLQIVDHRELRAVLAHEISHVANHDIAISSIAAAIATSITYLAQMAFWFGAFGGSNDREGGGSPIVLLLTVLLAPIAAMIIQLAVSRSREYQADESGAELIHDPEALASALLKIDAYAKKTPPATLSPSQAHLFIMNPFSGRNSGSMMARLFSTHPPTEDRVARLRAMAQGQLR